MNRLPAISLGSVPFLNARTFMLLLFFVTFSAIPAYAEIQKKHKQAKNFLNLLTTVKKEAPGEMIGSERSKPDGRLVDEITILQQDGRVVVVRVDSVNGKILSIKAPLSRDKR